MIEIRNMSSGYEGGTHIRIDDLTIRTGEMLGILGKNGCGKSTFLRALVGILPYQGSICVENIELRTIPRKARAKRIAYLPQQISMPRMSVYTLAAHGRYARMPFSKVLGEADRSAVDNALKTTGLWEMRGRRVDELSGGERQRAYLAMVLAQDADVLLLDEPASSLDIAHQMSMMSILRRLADEGRGIVVTSHDIPQSFCFCDRICLIRDGRAAAVAAPPALASEKDLLRDVMGMSLVRSDKGIYPYVLDE